MGYRQAPAYTRYLKQCRKEYGFDASGVASFTTAESNMLVQQINAGLDEESRTRNIWNDVGRYKGDAYTSFPQIEALLRGDLGDFYRSTYRCSFKIYFALIYRSRHDPPPSGSQMWHADGGPGTCINTMVYLTNASAEAGAIECLPWNESLSIFSRERRTIGRNPTREVRSNFYAEQINQHFPDRVECPTGQAGLVVAFRNNLIHKGGLPEQGHERTVLMFHTYPSDRPTPFEYYRRHGLAKRGPYPADPGF